MELFGAKSLIRLSIQVPIPLLMNFITIDRCIDIFVTAKNENDLKILRNDGYVGFSLSTHGTD